MEVIKEFMATPITWGSYFTASLVASAIMLAGFIGWIGICKVKEWIRHTRILKDD